MATDAELIREVSANTGIPESRLFVTNGWVVEAVGSCTCYGGGPYGHEPGCGSDPITQVDRVFQPDGNQSSMEF